MFRKTLIAAAIAMATFSAGTSGASAMNIANATAAIEAPQNTATVQKVGFKGKIRFKRHRFHRFHKFHGYHWGGSCHWLKRKAYRTGSRYWWKKYKRCLYFKYY